MKTGRYRAYRYSRSKTPARVFCAGWGLLPEQSPSVRIGVSEYLPVSNTCAICLCRFKKDEKSVIHRYKSGINNEERQLFVDFSD